MQQCTGVSGLLDRVFLVGAGARIVGSGSLFPAPIGRELKDRHPDIGGWGIPGRRSVRQLRGVADGVTDELVARLLLTTHYFRIR
jgi:hypothetical protein